MMLQPLTQTVLYLLENRMALPRENFTVQGFGFMRLRVSPDVRLHVWDARLRIAGVSDVHDHAQWAFNSIILSGSVVNIRFNVLDPSCMEPNAKLFTERTIKCGIGGGITEVPTRTVRLQEQRLELHTAGQQYKQEPEEVHRTNPVDGTVSIITQFRRDTDTARVFYPHGTEWVDAIPRAATLDEINDVGGLALKMMKAEVAA